MTENTIQEVVQKGKKKKMNEIKGKELQLIRGNWLLIQYQISKRRNMSEKIE